MQIKWVLKCANEKFYMRIQRQQSNIGNTWTHYYSHTRFRQCSPYKRFQSSCCYQWSCENWVLWKSVGKGTQCTCLVKTHEKLEELILPVKVLLRVGKARAPYPGLQQCLYNVKIGMLKLGCPSMTKGPNWQIDILRYWIKMCTASIDLYKVNNFWGVFIDMNKWDFDLLLHSNYRYYYFWPFWGNNSVWSKCQLGSFVVMGQLGCSGQWTSVKCAEDGYGFQYLRGIML